MKHQTPPSPEVLEQAFGHLLERFIHLLGTLQSERAPLDPVRLVAEHLQHDLESQSRTRLHYQFVLCNGESDQPFLMNLRSDTVSALVETADKAGIPPEELLDQILRKDLSRLRATIHQTATAA